MLYENLVNASLLVRVMNNRIRDARLSAGLTLKELAAKLEGIGCQITPAGISKYEMGKSKPPPTFLHALAAVLGWRPAVLAGTSKVEVTWLTFRKHSRLTKAAQQQIQAWSNSRIEQQIRLHEMLCPTDKPDFPRPCPSSSLKDAELAAEHLRKKWGLGEAPIESVTEVTEDRGGVVIMYPHLQDGFDGLCGWANGRYPVLVVSASSSVDRRRYNLAHELGHLVMDCRGTEAKEEEKLAHRFAAAFIVPAAVARRELGARRRNLNLAELALLKGKHGLSMQGWARRASDLGIISKGHYESLCRQFSHRGWRMQEPVAYEGQERPLRLRQLVLRALAEDIITPSAAEEIIPKVVEEAESIGLEPTADEKLWPSQLLRLPREQRRKHLALSAEKVSKHYAARTC